MPDPRYANRAAQRAQDAWRRINDRPTSLVLARNGVVVPAQTVRIEEKTGVRRDTGDFNQQVTMREAVVFGIQGHPTITNTDIKIGDRFTVGVIEYVVTGVTTYPGEIQAAAEGRSV